MLIFISSAHPGDCCSLPSPTRSPAGSKRPETDHFSAIFAPKPRRPSSGAPAKDPRRRNVRGPGGPRGQLQTAGSLRHGEFIARCVAQMGVQLLSGLTAPQVQVSCVYCRPFVSVGEVQIKMKFRSTPLALRVVCASRRRGDSIFCVYRSHQSGTEFSLAHGK